MLEANKMISQCLQVPASACQCQADSAGAISCQTLPNVYNTLTHLKPVVILRLSSPGI